MIVVWDEGGIIRQVTLDSTRTTDPTCDSEKGLVRVWRMEGSVILFENDGRKQLSMINRPRSGGKEEAARRKFQQPS
jgi:hypothetical protein